MSQLLVRMHARCLFGDVSARPGANADICCARRSSASRGRARACSCICIKPARRPPTSQLIALSRGPAQQETGIGAQILADLGLASIRLFPTNDPARWSAWMGSESKFLKTVPVTPHVFRAALGFLARIALINQYTCHSEWKRGICFCYLATTTAEKLAKRDRDHKCSTATSLCDAATKHSPDARPGGA